MLDAGSPHLQVPLHGPLGLTLHTAIVSVELTPQFPVPPSHLHSFVIPNPPPPALLAAT